MQRQAKHRFEYKDGHTKTRKEVDYDQVRVLAAQGLTIAQIGASLGMSTRWAYQRKAQDADFAEAYEEGLAHGVQEVTNKLFEKAKNGDNSCIFFYLKNRAGWSDNNKVQVEQNVNIKSISDMSLEDLIALDQSYEQSEEWTAIPRRD